MYVANSLRFASAMAIRTVTWRHEETEMQECGPGTVTSFNRRTSTMARKRRRKSSNTSQKCRVAVDWNTLSLVQKFNRVFAVYKSVTAGGADGSIMGVNGSINAVSTRRILDILGVNGKLVCDLGAADGKFMVCTFLAGAQRVIGVEFAQNEGYKMILDAVMRRMKQDYDIEFNLDWIGSAIEEVWRFCSLSILFGDSAVFETINTFLFSCSFNEFQETHLPFTPTGMACHQEPRITSWSFVPGLRL